MHGATGGTTSRRRRSGSSARSAAPRGSRPATSRSRRRCSTPPSAASRATTSRPSAASGRRRSSRRRRRSSSCCAEAAHEALGMVRRTLDGMAAGGLYDVVGGGFHRYSVDARWVVPHFEKMLYDNALLTSAYLHAWVVTATSATATIVEETVDYLLREMLLAERRARLRAGRRHRRRRGADVHWTADGVGRARARRSRCSSRSSTAARSCAASSTRRTSERLLALRSERPQPFRDDKAIASWNGLALAALAEAARRLDRDDWLAAAERLGGVPARSAPRRGRPRDAQRPRRSRQRQRVPRRPRERRARPARAPRRDRRRRAGCSRRAGSPTSRSTSSPTTSAAASSSRRATERRSRRARRISTTTRSRRGTRCSPRVLFRLGRIWGDDGARRAGEACCACLRPRWSASRAPSRGRSARSTLHLSPPRELAIVGDVRSDVAGRRSRGFAPETVVAVGPSDEVPLLAGKGLVDGRDRGVRLRAVRVPRAGDTPGGTRREIGRASEHGCRATVPLLRRRKIGTTRHGRRDAALPWYPAGGWGLDGFRTVRRRSRATAVRDERAAPRRDSASRHGDDRDDRRGRRCVGSLRPLRGHRRPAHRRPTSRGRGRRRGVPRALPRQGRGARRSRASPRPSPSTSGSSRRSSGR